MVPDAVAERLRSATSPGLLLGVPRRLISELAGSLSRTVITADIGAPLFGVPGAVCSAHFEEGGWSLEDVEALCTFDAARFRLPLLLALRRIVTDRAFVQLPGITRGMAAAELVTGAIELLGASTVVIGSDEPAVHLRHELAARGVLVLQVAPEKKQARARTALWDAYLEGAVELKLELDHVRLLGAPPPLKEPETWTGRQVALLDEDGRTMALGEASSLDASSLRLRGPSVDLAAVRSLLTRDARRSEDGSLATDRVTKTTAIATPSDLRTEGRFQLEESPPWSLSSAKAILVNGVFGDPLVHIRMRHQKRSLLFDLGDSARLPSRIVHQVSDVFISHCHFDHIGGFLWFLRSCLGAPGPRRIYGPHGLADHLESMTRGIHWDRIGNRGPVFEIFEVGGAEIHGFRLKAGGGPREMLGKRPLVDGILLDEPEFRVRTTILDHGIPVLAFAFEEAHAFHVRKEVLVDRGYAPGAWLSELKQRLYRRELDVSITLPDGTGRRVDELSRELVVESPGQKLCYATDLDDNPSNRRALTELAKDATIFICEASFRETDSHLARATQHLTARACGEIAATANVRKLVPFHFSKRYEHDPEPVYDEVRAAFPGVSA